MNEIERTYAVQVKYESKSDWTTRMSGLDGYDAYDLLRDLRQTYPNDSWRMTVTIVEVVDLQTFDSTRS
jgi:hypothetical protein